MATRNVSLLDRVLSKIEFASDGCWLWRASLRAGYGQIKVDGTPKGAHRVTYELLVGDIPNGLVIDHLCRVRRCVNPDHLEPVTQIVNMSRGFWGAKEACPKGHPYSPSNTRIQLRPDGTFRKRVCRECDRVRNKAQKLAAKERALLARKETS